MARRYIGAYYRTVLRHYELAAGHLVGTKGYEYYGAMAANLKEYGDEVGIEFFTELQVYGTPEQCYERIVNTRNMVGNDSFVAVFSYGGMPPDEAERNLRLFASDVMPELQRLPG
jgi:alkanesulfonate monooxygenase SsuD/methylene tetrahydromethanopterin reductase-like flavin-dependent oxidoreductase (luciferase family)